MLHADVDVFNFDLRQVGFECQGVFRLEDVDGRRPRPVRARFAFSAWKRFAVDAKEDYSSRSSQTDLQFP